MRKGDNKAVSSTALEASKPPSTNSPTLHTWNRSSSEHNLTLSLFQGGVEELKNNYFDCASYQQTDRYVTTIKDITESIGRSYVNGGDVRASIDAMAVVAILPPDDPIRQYQDIVDLSDTSRVIHMAMDQVSFMEMDIFRQKINSFIKQQNILTANLRKAYSLILGQCTEMMKSKLLTSPRWEAIEMDQDAIAFLELIKDITYQFDNQKYIPLSINNAKLHFTHSGSDQR